MCFGDVAINYTEQSGRVDAQREDKNINNTKKHKKEPYETKNVFATGFDARGAGNGTENRH